MASQGTWEGTDTMDDRGFDDLVRRAARASGTRRGALLGVLAALAGGVGLAEVEAGARAERRKSCAAGLSRCRVGKKKPCVDLAADPAHCGTCGAACAAGEACEAGVCTSNCIPICDGRQCGDDGCGESCGQCGGDGRCRDGRCLEPEDDGPIDPGPDAQCIADNDTCGKEDTCCDPERACQVGQCDKSPTCCAPLRARCKEDCDCCGPFSVCGKGICQPRGLQG